MTGQTMMGITRTASALVAVALAGGILAGCSAAPVSNAPAPGTAASTTPTATPRAVVTYTAVTLFDGSTYFGTTVATGDARLIALNDAYYLLGTAKGGATDLRRFGGEVYKPRAQMLVPASAVLYEQPLTPASGAVHAILVYEAKHARPDTATPDLPRGEYYAVVLRSGEVFFGKTRLQGQTAVVSPAYFLRYKDQGAAKSGQIRSLDQVVLVPQSTTGVSPTGELRVPLSAIMYLQRLAHDSPVIDAAGS